MGRGGGDAGAQEKAGGKATTSKRGSWRRPFILWRTSGDSALAATHLANQDLASARLRSFWCVWAGAKSGAALKVESKVEPRPGRAAAQQTFPRYSMFSVHPGLRSSACEEEEKGGEGFSTLPERSSPTPATKSTF